VFYNHYKSERTPWDVNWADFEFTAMTAFVYLHLRGRRLGRRNWRRNCEFVFVVAATPFSAPLSNRADRFGAFSMNSRESSAIIASIRSDPIKRIDLQIAGAGLLALGILLKLKNDDIQNFIPDKYHLGLPPILLIAIGSVIFVTAFFGCCGAIKESTCMLTTVIRRLNPPLA
jgi:hypothetical protein